jgi:hypothetical protein
MQLRENLTKENFWNRMMSEYPNATNAFCKWVDEYKEATDWKKIFGETTRPDYVFVAPKFHDLPYAMQVGIWIEYVCQLGGCQWEIEDMFAYDLPEDIEGVFRELLEEEAKED